MLVSSSFLATLSQGSRSPFLVDLVLLAVVDLVAAQDHGGLTCVLGVVVPDGLVLRDILLLFVGVLEGLVVAVAAFFLAEADTALVVVQVEA